MRRRQQARNNLGQLLERRRAFAEAAARRSTSRLFRNDMAVPADGPRRLRLTDVTATAGVGWRQYGMGAATGDYDSDGDPDLFLTSFGPEALFRNTGDGTFSDVTSFFSLPDYCAQPSFMVPFARGIFPAVNVMYNPRLAD